MRSFSLRRAAPLLALAGLAATGCSTFIDDPAVTVNGTEISVDSVEDELEVIEGNEAYRSALEQSYGATFGGASKGTFGATFAAQIISLQVYYELLEQALAERGVTISEDDTLAAREQTEQQFTTLGDEVFEEFPEDYRDELVRQNALLGAAQRAAVENAPDAEDYFDEHRDEFVQACVSHILVSTENSDEGAARAEAEAIAGRLAAGEDFAAVATAESDDPGSAPAGGDLQCGPPTQYVPEFRDAVLDQTVGQVGDLVQTEFGFHLILVRSRTVPSFEEVEAEVEQRLATEGEGGLREFLLEVACDEDAEIDVNPRYGTWDRSPCEDALGFPTITPPVGPTTTSTAPLPEE